MNAKKYILLIITLVVIIAVLAFLTVLRYIKQGIYVSSHKSENVLYNILYELLKTPSNVSISYMQSYIEASLKLISKAGMPFSAYSLRHVVLKYVNVFYTKKPGFKIFGIDGKELNICITSNVGRECTNFSDFIYIIYISNKSSVECFRGSATILIRGKVYRLSTHGVCITLRYNITPDELYRVYLTSLRNMLNLAKCLDGLCNLRGTVNYVHMLKYYITSQLARSNVAYVGIVKVYKESSSLLKLLKLNLWKIDSSVNVSKHELSAEGKLYSLSKNVKCEVSFKIVENYTLTRRINTKYILSIINKMERLNINTLLLKKSLKIKYLLYAITLLRNVSIPTPLVSVYIMPAELSLLISLLYKYI